MLNASVLGGFPLADIPHVGLSAVIVADRDPSAAAAFCAELLGEAWHRRADFVFSSEPMAASIAAARSLPGAPILLVDHRDNAEAGGSQDDMSVIAEVIRQGFENVAAGPIWDPQAVARLIEAGVVATLTLEVSGRTDTPAIGLKGRKLWLTGTVRRITDGRYHVIGPTATGTLIDLGRCAVLDTGAVELVISERRIEPFDIGCFTHCGIDPARTFGQGSPRSRSTSCSSPDPECAVPIIRFSRFAICAGRSILSTGTRRSAPGLNASKGVGWVERSETHHRSTATVGFADPPQGWTMHPGETP